MPVKRLEPVGDSVHIYPKSNWIFDVDDVSTWNERGIRIAHLELVLDCQQENINVENLKAAVAIVAATQREHIKRLSITMYEASLYRPRPNNDILADCIDIFCVLRHLTRVYLMCRDSYYDWRYGDGVIRAFKRLFSFQNTPLLRAYVLDISSPLALRQILVDVIPNTLTGEIADMLIHTPHDFYNKNGTVDTTHEYWRSNFIPHKGKAIEHHERLQKENLYTLMAFVETNPMYLRRLSFRTGFISDEMALNYLFPLVRQMDGLSLHIMIFEQVPKLSPNATLIERKISSRRLHLSNVQEDEARLSEDMYQNPI